MKHILIAAAVSLLCAVTSFAQFSIVDSTFNDTTKADRTLSFAYANNGSKLILARGETENLARLKKAYIVYTGGAPARTDQAIGSKTIDGNVGTWVAINGRGSGKDNTGSYIMIDLLSIRLINRIVVKQPFYDPANPSNPLIRVRGYTVEAGTDSLTMTRVLQQPNNAVPNPDTTFDVVAARYIKFTITAVSAGTDDTDIGEIEVYGTGYLSAGVYISQPRQAVKPANWGVVTWDAVLPNSQTFMNFQFRTGNTPAVDSTWSPWSEQVAQSGSVFGVFEPKKYLQYRVNLSTTSLQTPQLNSVTINYDTVMVAANAVASIDTRVEPVLKKVDVTYHVRLNFAQSNYGVDTIRLLTPTPVQVKSVLRNNTPVEPRILYEIGKVALVFSDTISTQSEIVINFSTTLYLDQMSFPCEISSSKSPYYNPQRVDRTLINGIESWTIQSTGIAPRLLVDTKIEPNPFTPNGDGKNDETAVKFYVANLAVPRALTLTVFDVAGRVVRNLFRDEVLAGAYVDLTAIRWDGRNNDGKIVRPGVYIIKIQLDADAGGGEIVCKTVTVAY